MSEQTQVAAPQQPTTLTVAQAAQRYAESKVAPANPVSDAARTLGQRAAQARQERTTQANAQSQEIAQPVEDEQPNPGDEPQDNTAAAESPDAKTAEAQDDPSGTIDLGEGVALTKDEIRENIMLKADHTRRLQALAEERKGLEAERSQKLTQLDTMIGHLQQKIGQPKTLKQWLSEDPVSGLERFADQQEQMAEIDRAQMAKSQAEQRAYSEAVNLRDKQLAESYQSSWSDPAQRDKDYTAMSVYALKEGADPSEVKMMTKPWMIKVLHKAMLQDAAEANAGNVTKMISGKPQVVRPGAKVSAQAQRQSSIQQATARLKSTGSIADAAAILGLRRAQRG